MSRSSHQPPFPPDVHTVYVIGDLHGFIDDAHRILTERVGADDDWRLPDGVAVVQVGDLLHKGDHGPELLDRVDAAICLNSGRWVQLWGNHETAALQGRPRGWDPEPGHVTRTLRRWWDDGTAQVAAWVPTPDGGDLLVTHAGLSVGWWQRIGSPVTAADAAEALNSRLGDDPHDAFGRGWVLDRGTPSRCAGPVWNDTAAEGWARWAARGEVPFTQVHGHAAPWSWRRGRWLTGTTRLLRRTVELDPHRRRARLELPGGALVSIDTAPASDSGSLPGDPVLEVPVRTPAELLAAA